MFSSFASASIFSMPSDATTAALAIQVRAARVASRQAKARKAVYVRSSSSSWTFQARCCIICMAVAVLLRGFEARAASMASRRTRNGRVHTFLHHVGFVASKSASAWGPTSDLAPQRIRRDHLGDLSDEGGRSSTGGGRIHGMDRRRIFEDRVLRWHHVLHSFPLCPEGPFPNLDTLGKDRDSRGTRIEISTPSDPILLVPRCLPSVTLLGRVMRPTQSGLFDVVPIRGI